VITPSVTLQIVQVMVHAIIQLENVSVMLHMSAHLVLFQTPLVQMLVVVLVRVINELESAIVHLVTTQLLVIAVLKSVLVIVPAVLTAHVTLMLGFVSAEIVMLEEHVKHLI